MEAEIKAAALAAGLVDVDLVPLIRRDGVIVAADGSITGIPEAIAAFKTSKPSYFRDGTPATPQGPPAPRAPGAPGAPAANPSPPLANVKDMPKADYEAMKRQTVRDLRRMG